MAVPLLWNTSALVPADTHLSKEGLGWQSVLWLFIALFVATMVVILPCYMELLKSTTISKVRMK